MSPETDTQDYLAPTPFIDSDAESVVELSRRAVSDASDETERAVRLYYAVRDGVVYTPYCDFRSPDTYRASAVLARGAGFCVGKASLLAAAGRAAGIPARVGFADVKNHLCTPRLRALMGTDVFYFHGYTEFLLRGRWVKATPAFDKTLCDRFGVHALEFDGRDDSLFQPYDRSGRRHMEYVGDRGPRRDVPMDEIVATFERNYQNFVSGTASITQFRKEAEEASTP